MPSKKIVNGNVESKAKKDKGSKNIKRYKVKGVGSGEKDIYVVFAGNVDYKVEKLETGSDSLDTAIGGTDVVWLGNFQIKKSNSDNAIVDGVTYKVFVKASDLNSNDPRIAFYDGSTYGFQTGQSEDVDISDTGSTPQWASMKYIEFSKGDPAIGIVKP